LLLQKYRQAGHESGRVKYLRPGKPPKPLMGPSESEQREGDVTDEDENGQTGVVKQEKVERLCGHGDTEEACESGRSTAARSAAPPSTAAASASRRTVGRAGRFDADHWNNETTLCDVSCCARVLYLATCCNFVYEAGWSDSGDDFNKGECFWCGLKAEGFPCELDAVGYYGWYSCTPIYYLWCLPSCILSLLSCSCGLLRVTFLHHPHEPTIP